jgi:hypothetical protein
MLADTSATCLTPNARSGFECLQLRDARQDSAWTHALSICERGGVRVEDPAWWDAWRARMYSRKCSGTVSSYLITRKVL